MAGGTIRKRNRKSGVRYQAIVDLGPDPITGARRQVSEAFTAKREASLWLTKTMKAVDDGTAVAASALTVNGLLDHWLDTRIRFKSAKTYEDYTRTLRLHVRPYLGQKAAQKLTPKEVHDWVIARLDAGVGQRSLELALVNLKTAYRQALDLGLVARNPAGAVSVPRGDNQKKEMQTWTAGEAQRFLEVCNAHATGYGPIFLVSLDTGMRRGELLGLRWADVDWIGAALRVRQAVGPVNNRARVKKTKNPQSMRDVPISKQVLEALREHRALQNERRLFLGAAWVDNDLIFCSDIGTPINPPNLWRLYQKLVIEAGVPYIRIHDHRHTHVTWQIEDGGDLKAISRRVGHGNTRITADLYGHVTPRMQQDLVDKVSRRLFGDG